MALVVERGGASPSTWEAMPSQPRTDARRRGREALRQATLVAGVGVGRAVVAGTDGTLAEVVRRAPRPLLAAAGLGLAAGAAVLVHHIGADAAAPLGGGVSEVAGMLLRDETPSSAES
jgi:hypothetical protein